MAFLFPGSDSSLFLVLKYPFVVVGALVSK
jgi:hypothetical protein